jgi:hypothetical protein
MKKHSAFLAKFLFSVIILCLSYGISNAQQRYKHVPRVKVKANKKEIVSYNKTEKEAVTATFIAEENQLVDNKAGEPIIEPDVNIEVSSSPVVVPIHTNQKKSSKVPFKTKKVAQKASSRFFTEKLKENSRLLSIKEVDKTNMSGGLIAMIILYAVGGLLVLLAVLFFYILPGFSLIAFLIMIIIGAVLLAAASVMLALWRAGVFQ